MLYIYNNFLSVKLLKFFFFGLNPFKMHLFQHKPRRTKAYISGRLVVFYIG